MVDCKEIKKIINDYFNNQLIIRQQPYGCQIITPFLDYINDSLSFHIFDEGYDKYRLTDLGDTLNRIENLGIDWKSGLKLKNLISISDRLKIGFDDEGILTIESNIDELGHDVGIFITGLQEVGSFYLLAKQRTVFDFEKKVGDFFREGKIRPIRKKIVTGKHNRAYKISFSFNDDNLLCQTLHAEHKDSASNIITRYIAEFIDIKEAHPKTESMVIYNHEAPIEKANFFDLMEEKTDYVLPLRNKRKILSVVKSQSSTL